MAQQVRLFAATPDNLPWVQSPEATRWKARTTLVSSSTKQGHALILFRIKTEDISSPDNYP